MTMPKGLARVVAVYSRMEQMRSLERRMAADAADEIVCKETIAAAARDGYHDAAREAMGAGDREEWAVAVTARGAVEGRIQRLAELRAEREEMLAECVVAHRASRLQLEQMERLLARRRAADAIEDGRRQQLGADDRYAACMASAQTVKVRDTE